MKPLYSLFSDKERMEARNMIAEVTIRRLYTLDMGREMNIKLCHSNNVVLWRSKCAEKASSTHPHKKRWLHGFMPSTINCVQLRQEWRYIRLHFAAIQFWWSVATADSDFWFWLTGLKPWHDILPLEPVHADHLQLFQPSWVKFSKYWGENPRDPNLRSTSTGDISWHSEHKPVSAEFLSTGLQ